jgi:nucleotide-binding universal stress UspA family protein
MPTTIRHILVPTDFGLPSDHALACARTLASSFGATIHLIHVLERPFVTPGAYQFHQPDTPARREERYQQAQRVLRRIASTLDNCGVSTTIETRDGDAVDQILKAARDYGADIIAMGTHGRSGLQHMLTGSVADQLIRRAACPVVTVRESGKVAACPAGMTGRMKVA